MTVGEYQLLVYIFFLTLALLNQMYCHSNIPSELTYNIWFYYVFVSKCNMHKLLFTHTKVNICPSSNGKQYINYMQPRKVMQVYGNNYKTWQL